MQKRTENIGLDHHLLVDGTRKSNESKIDSISDFSRKARTKGTRDISVLYAFDFEKMEPICSKCYPGNMLDVTSYQDFIVENCITKGVIVADKGFPSSAAEPQFSAHKDLHYLNPIKRNSKFITTHNLLNFDRLLPGYSGITYKKEKCVGINKWLYSFRNSADAALEEKSWLEQAQKNNTYNAEEFIEQQKKFGTIILECDLDIAPEMIYKIYNDRWEIEIVMRYYKNACQYDETRVHDDYSVIGSEFCDFLSTVLTFRLLKKLDKTELLKSYTYKKIMSVLKRAKKVRVDTEEWQLVNMNPSQIKILKELSLVVLDEPIKQRRGRPKKSI
ncbi:MAG: transposase [Succinivibrionaceae bacterium]